MLCRLRWALCHLLLSAAMLPAVTAAADPLVVRIEEDWEMIVANPAPRAPAPQITTTMSLYGQLAHPRFDFTLNPGGRPAKSSGGLQVRVTQSSAGRPLVRRARTGKPLRQAGETVTWTQVLAVGRGKVTYAIKNGRSQTWGDFGSEDKLSVTIPAPVANLNQYDADLSLLSSGLSGVVLGPPRVHRLSLVEVRAYTPEGLLSRDDSPVVVYER